MEAVGNSLIEESNLNIDLEVCVNERVDECNLTTSFLCGLCSKIYKLKGGLALHTRAWHENGCYKVSFVIDFGGHC